MHRALPFADVFCSGKNVGSSHMHKMCAPDFSLAAKPKNLSMRGHAASDVIGYI